MIYFATIHPPCRAHSFSLCQQHSSSVEILSYSDSPSLIHSLTQDQFIFTFSILLILEFFVRFLSFYQPIVTHFPLSHFIILPTHFFFCLPADIKYPYSLPLSRVGQHRPLHHFNRSNMLCGSLHPPPTTHAHLPPATCHLLPGRAVDPGCLCLAPGLCLSLLASATTRLMIYGHLGQESRFKAAREARRRKASP